jgi:hypothetical protein
MMRDFNEPAKELFVQYFLKLPTDQINAHAAVTAIEKSSVHFTGLAASAASES